MKVAIMQPCYLPWRGYFALMKLADVFLHLDDVPLPQGRSFQTRVQLKTAAGKRWLTVPVSRHADQLIRDVRIVDDGWRLKHRKSLQQNLPSASSLVADIYEQPWNVLADVNIALIERMAAALGLPSHHRRSSEFQAPDRGWKKLLHLCKRVGADCYITGHGARNYFDHEAFENAGVEVMYLEYDLTPYPQRHGQFDPFVTALDVLENAPHPPSHIGAALVPWREFLARSPVQYSGEASESVVGS